MRRSWTLLPVAALALVSACGSDSPVTSSSDGDWCDFAQRVESTQSDLDELEPGGDLDSFAEAFEAAFTEFNAILDDARGAAPDEIADDVALVADTFADVTEVLEDADYDLFAVDPAALEALDSPEVDEATRNIEEYNERECGISADDDGAADAGDDATGDGDDATDDDGAVDDGDESADGADEPSDVAVGGGADSDWCGLARLVESSFDEFESLEMTDPVALEEFMRESQDLLATAALQAPDPIADDVATTVQFFAEFDAVLAAADYRLLDADLSLLEDAEDEIETASDNIEAYNEDVCGIAADDDVDDDLEDAVGGGDDDGAFDPAAGTIREQLVASLVAGGFTEEEASCIADGLDFSDPAVLAGDTTGMLELFDDCGISLERLGEIGG